MPPRSSAGCSPRAPALPPAQRGQTRTFPPDLAIVGAAPSPDGPDLWLSTVRGLVRARPDGALLDRAPGIPPMYHGMFVIDGGATLVGLNDDGFHTRVTVVDLR